MAFPNGFRHLPGYLDGPAQRALLAEVEKGVAEAPLYVPTMPRSGKPLSVQMTNCGPLGWLTESVLTVCLALVALPVMMLQWGFAGADIRDWIKSLLFGFEIGQIRISLVRFFTPTS